MKDKLFKYYPTVPSLILRQIENHASIQFVMNFYMQILTMNNFAI